jgi:hypothetical protein
MAAIDFHHFFSDKIQNSICLLCDVDVASSAQPFILTQLEEAHVCSVSDLLTHKAAVELRQASTVILY